MAIGEAPDFNPAQAVAAVLTDAVNLSQDPNTQQRARDARRVIFYATQLSEGDQEALKPRYRTTEWGNSDNPFEDTLAEDPTRDPRVSALAADREALRIVRERLQELQDQASA